MRSGLVSPESGRLWIVKLAMLRLARRENVGPAGGSIQWFGDK